MKHEVCAYTAPEMKVVEIGLSAVICESNVSMREYDLGDGGFGEVIGE